jgi:ribosomal protein S18 acetylase RimI-like enzyme
MWKVAVAMNNDIDSWMNLVDRVKWNFPGLDTKQDLANYKDTVIKNINRGTALCVKNNEQVIGILVFSINQKRIGCIAVDPEYRKQGIASTLIKKCWIDLMQAMRL